LSGLLRRAALILIVFVSLQVFYSPQWILWLSPLLIPLAGCRRPIFGLIVLVDVVTYLTFPVVFDLPSKPVKHVLSTFLVLARFGGLTALASTLWSAEFARSPQTEISENPCAAAP
jgi:hypothetical protein